MNSIWMYALVIGILLIGLVATLWIGASKENREGNPAYDRNSLPNWVRLTAIYVVATAGFIAVLLWMMR